MEDFLKKMNIQKGETEKQSKRDRDRQTEINEQTEIQSEKDKRV